MPPSTMGSRTRSSVSWQHKPIGLARNSIGILPSRPSRTPLRRCQGSSALRIRSANELGILRCDHTFYSNSTTVFSVHPLQNTPLQLRILFAGWLILVHHWYRMDAEQI